MNDQTGQAASYLKDRTLGVRLRALSDKAGYAASGGEVTSREIKTNNEHRASAVQASTQQNAFNGVLITDVTQISQD